MSDSDKDKKLVGLFDKVLKELADKNNSVNVIDINTDTDDTITHSTDTNNTDNKLFTYTVSNPPYQIDTGGKRHQIYPIFLVNSWLLSHKSVMIFPIGWQKSTGRASGSSLHKTIREDKSLIEVDNYYEDLKKNKIMLFSGIGTSGVNIILRDDSFNTDTVVFKEYGDTIEPNKDMSVVKYWSDATDKIFKKLESFMADNNISGMNNKVTGRGNAGAYTADNASWTDNSRPFAQYFTDYFDKNKTYKILGKVQKGDYVVKNVLKNATGLKEKAVNNCINKWTIAWFVAAGGKSAWRKYQIAPAGTLLSNALIGINFDTEKELKNFEKYFTSLFYRFCFGECGVGYQSTSIYNRFALDLSTITNPRTGLTGWDSDWTDDDLQELLKDYLTEDDWVYIKETALKSDKGRQ